MDDDVDFLAWYRLYYLLILWARYRWTRSFKLSDDENKWFNELKKKWTLITKAGRDKRYDLLYDAKVLNRYFRNMDASPLLKEIAIIHRYQEKFQALFEDIRAAKETVHVEYYAFLMTQLAINFRCINRKVA